jgi:predicted O-methyltransferase YrrM
VGTRSQIQIILKDIQGVPIFVPTFNNPTYAKNMARQLNEYALGEIIFLDGGSTNPEMLHFFASSNHHTITLEENFGPRYIVTNPDIYDTLPNFFVLTDPDLEFSLNLPNNFIENFISLSNRYSIGKLGLALNILEDSEFVNSQLFINGHHHTIREWESQFWTQPVKYDSFDGYVADIDTTFALYNKNFFKPDKFASAVRLSTFQGLDISCKHLPWYQNNLIPDEERDYYKSLPKPSDFSYYGLAPIETIPESPLSDLQSFVTRIQNDSSLSDIAYVPRSSFIAHAPFLRYLIRETRPNILVELGTDRGYSYFAACQTMQSYGISGRAYAVDNWTGDVHVGIHSVETYENIIQVNQQYDSFSSILKMDFDKALDRFEDGSIDYLVIDGTHTYDAVKNDFENWFPKMSQNGVIMFHDIHVRITPFGVFRLWEELKSRFDTIEFTNQYGLGILFTGVNYSDNIEKLLAYSRNSEWHDIEAAFAFHGSKIVDGLQNKHQETEVQNKELEVQNKELEVQNKELEVQNKELEVQFAEIINSEAWKMTYPLRWFMNAIRELVNFRNR